MLLKFSIKLALFLGALILGDVSRKTASDYRIWLNYLDVLDEAESKAEVRPSTKLILNKASVRVRVACFIAYLSLMEPIAFVTSATLIVLGSAYLVAKSISTALLFI